MRFYIGCGIVLSLFLSTTSANAADLQRELDNLKEDVKVLQRQVYRNDESATKASASANSNVQVKIGEYDEIIRKVNGRMDDLEYRVKQIDEKLDKINRDMEIRFKILEGRPVPANLAAPAPTVPTTYDAPVAKGASKVAIGDAIHGDDLAPIGGEISPKAEGQPQALVPDNLPAPSTKIANAQDMYETGMQAYRAGYYDEAELAFQHILQQFPKDQLAGNAQYWLGEVYLKQNNFSKAKIAFKDGWEKYSKGNKAADSLFKLGVAMRSLKENKNACIVFMSFPEEFPKANADLKSRVQAEAKKLGCK